MICRWHLISSVWPWYAVRIEKYLWGQESLPFQQSTCYMIAETHDYGGSLQYIMRVIGIERSLTWPLRLWNAYTSPPSEILQLSSTYRRVFFHDVHSRVESGESFLRYFTSLCYHGMKCWNTYPTGLGFPPHMEVVSKRWMYMEVMGNCVPYSTISFLLIPYIFDQL